MPPLFFYFTAKVDTSINEMNRDYLKRINALSEFVLEKRLEQLQNVLSQRTRYLTIVLEDIFQPQNASAVLRSCECFGVQDVHIIENTNKFNVNPKVVLGATKWLNLYKYSNHNDNTISAINHLREVGYRIVVTSPHAKDNSLEDFDLSKGKIALFFGSELNGLSDTALSNADETIYIPTVGFTESLNISVSAAICIQTLISKLRKSGINYKLSELESNELILKWLRLSVKSWRSIEKRMFPAKNITANKQ